LVFFGWLMALVGIDLARIPFGYDAGRRAVMPASRR
jgi:hypothetical protein